MSGIQLYFPLESKLKINLNSMQSLTITELTAELHR